MSKLNKLVSEGNTDGNLVGKTELPSGTTILPRLITAQSREEVLRLEDELNSTFNIGSDLRRRCTRAIAAMLLRYPAPDNRPGKTLCEIFNGNPCKPGTVVLNMNRNKSN